MKVTTPPLENVQVDVKTKLTCGTDRADSDEFKTNESILIEYDENFFHWN